MDIPTHHLANLTYAANQAADSLQLSWTIYERSEGDRPSWQDQVRALDALDKLLAVTRMMRKAVESDVGPLIPPEAVIPGIGQITTHGSGTKTRWDVDALKPVVARKLGERFSDDREIMVDEDGVVLPVREVVMRTAARSVEAMSGLLGATPSRDWRATPLKGLGIDPKEFKSEEWAGYRVSITQGIVDAEAS